MWEPLLCGEGTGRVFRRKVSPEKENENRRGVLVRQRAQPASGLAFAGLGGLGTMRWCISSQGLL